MCKPLLSGGIGTLGAHVATLIANDNKLTGHLGDALVHAAPEIKTIKVSGNEFHGSYSFIQRLASVEHLDIEDNSLGEGEVGERHSGDPLPRMIASLGTLKHYAVAGNKLGSGALRTTPTAKTEVHVTLVLRVPAHKFCSGCSVAARLHTHECAAHATCRGERDQNIAARLECVVAAHAPHGAVAKIERVVPHVAADGTVLSVAALTVTLPPAAPSEEGAAPAPVDADEVARAMQTHIGEGAGPIWNRAAAAAASCDQQDAHGMAYRGAEVERVVARAACGAGLSGDQCLHFCPTTWARVDERVRADSIAKAQPKPSPEPDQFLSALGAPKDAPYGAPLVTSSPAKLGQSAVPGRSFHESLHYVYKGAAGERLPFSTSLDQCTISCRAHAAMAITDCNNWLREVGRCGLPVSNPRFLS